LLVVACGSSGERDAAYDEYYRELAPLMQALDRELATVVTSQSGLEGGALSSNLEVYARTLDTFAANLDGLDPPEEVEEAHGRLGIASRALADVHELLSQTAITGASAAVVEEGDVSLRGFETAVEWYNACHELQDAALARGIDADLRCVEALHLE
jgi:hypothetical protein